MGIEVLKKRLNILLDDKRTKISIFSTCLVGMLCYLYYITNNINNHDQIQTTPDGFGTGIPSGRWLLQILGDITTYIIGVYNIPFIFGCLSIFMIGCVSIVLIHYFEIKSKIMCFLLSAITVSFPTIATGMLYACVIHYYTFSIILGMCGIYLLKMYCEKPCTISASGNYITNVGGGKKLFVVIIITALLFSCSMGIYQAYMPFFAAMLLLRLLQLCLKEDTQWKNILMYSVSALFSLVLSYLFYRIILNVFLAMYQAELISYKGIDKMGQIDFQRLPFLIYQAYKSYILMFIEPYCRLNTTALIKLCIAILYIFCVLVLVFLWKKTNIFKTIELCIFLILLPLASNFIIVMSPDEVPSNVVLMGVISIFYLPIILYETIINKKDYKIRRISRNILSVAIFLVVINYIWSANVNYRALYYANRKMENYYNIRGEL